jgi:hypothetical protein
MRNVATAKRSPFYQINSCSFESKLKARSAHQFSINISEMQDSATTTPDTWTAS